MILLLLTYLRVPFSSFLHCDVYVLLFHGESILENEQPCNYWCLIYYQLLVSTLIHKKYKFNARSYWIWQKNIASNYMRDWSRLLISAWFSLMMLYYSKWTNTDRTMSRTRPRRFVRRRSRAMPAGVAIVEYIPGIRPRTKNMIIAVTILHNDFSNLLQRPLRIKNPIELIKSFIYLDFLIGCLAE